MTLISLLQINKMNYLADCLLHLTMFNTNAQVKKLIKINIYLHFLIRFIYKQVNYFYKN